jgi:hypothetical protein
LAPSEVEVVQLTRALVGLLPSRAALDILGRPRARVSVGRAAIALLQDSLRKGFIRALARRGGGLPRRHLDGAGGVTSRGRLFERTAPPALVVSARSGALLEWLLTTSVTATPVARSIAGPLTAGDELFFFLAAERLVELGLGEALGRGPFGASTLVKLAFPIQLGATKHDVANALQDEPMRLLVLGLERDLCSRIRATEQLRRATTQEAAVLEAEEAIRQGPVRFATAAITAGRPDLGLFVLRGVGSLLEAGAADVSAWMPAVSPTLALSRRERLARTAGVWLEVVDAYKRVAKRAAARSFVDDDYDANEMLLGELEPWTSRGFHQADALSRSLSSLDALVKRDST